MKTNVLFFIIGLLSFYGFSQEEKTKSLDKSITILFYSANFLEDVDHQPSKEELQNMIKALAKNLSDTYSAAELKKMHEFYDSALGRKIIANRKLVNEIYKDEVYKFNTSKIDGLVAKKNIKAVSVKKSTKSDVVINLSTNKEIYLPYEAPEPPKEEVIKKDKKNEKE